MAAGADCLLAGFMQRRKMCISDSHYVRRELLLQNYVDRLANESSDESVEIDEELDYLFLEE